MATRTFSATSGSERLGRLAMLGLVVLPLLIGVVLSWALATPTAHLDRMTAAIVNDDEPVTIDGRTVPLGRQFAAGLMEGTATASAAPSASPSPSPAPSTPPSTTGPATATSAESAATAAPSASASPTATATPGPTATAEPTPLPSPAAATPIESPTDFDWVLTNPDEAAEGLATGRYAAVVTIPASFSAAATSFSGPASAARQAVIEVATTPASAFLDPALTQAVTQAAVEALNRQLIEQYLAQVYTGFTTIDEQIGEAASGAAQLAEGAASLDSGAAQLAAGAESLAAGLAAIETGAGDLSAGITELDAAAAPLPGAASLLADGAAEVATGVDALASDLAGATAEFAAVVARVCATPGPVCTRATTALENLRALDAKIDALARGADGVATGNADLAEAANGLVDGIDAAATGADELAGGAAEASAGGAELASGSDELASGASEVDDGAAQLAAGLAQASEQIPSYTDDDITTLSTVVSQPVVADQDAGTPGIVSVPLSCVLALWLGGFAMALARRAVPIERLSAADPSRSIAWRAVLPGLGLGAAQGLVVGVVVLTGLAVTPAQGAAFTVASIVIGAVFAIANQGLAAAFGGAGRLVAVFIALVALTAGLSSTVPPFIAAAAGASPTAPALQLLTATLTDTDAASGAIWGALALLALIAVASFALVLAGVAVRRSGDPLRFVPAG
ncbi:YhgE/Pip domain-containing protein [Agromyces sp. NPDC057679]|uniref:YhgE/Pip domain-containing protein n=1 Tax=Agromyces sp. NPDC057679 TaxID=3346207 RepID=UPI00366EFE96